MQTFMPYIKFRDSLASLDDLRLNNQINETSILVQALTGAKAWTNHPAALMWQGHVLSLCNYGAIACVVWADRRGQDIDKRAVWFASAQNEARAAMGVEEGVRQAMAPLWIGDLWFHRSHRSNLMRKDSVQYHWNGAPLDMPYLWPRNTEEGYQYYVSKPDMKRLASGERVLPSALEVKDDGEVLIHDD